MPKENHRRSLSEPVTLTISKRTSVRQIFFLTRFRTLGQPPLFKPSKQPPRRLPASCLICHSKPHQRRPASRKKIANTGTISPRRRLTGHHLHHHGAYPAPSGPQPRHHI